MKSGYKESLYIYHFYIIPFLTSKYISNKPQSNQNSILLVN